ncbi:hypothetical protein D3C79_808260 [compost metagenome]
MGQLIDGHLLGPRAGGFIEQFAALVTGACRRIGLRPRLPAHLDEVLQRLRIVEQDQRPEVLDAKTQPNPGIGHAHVDVLTGPIVSHHTKAAACADKDQAVVDAGEDRITLGLLHLITDARLLLIKLAQHLLAHLLHIAPLLLRCVPLGGAASQQHCHSPYQPSHPVLPVLVHFHSISSEQDKIEKFRARKK